MQEPDKQLCFPYLEEELFFGAENMQREIADFNRDYELLTEMFPILKQTETETNALSFGEKKVLLLAGMILKDPDIFLLDEPGAGLSDDYRVRFAELIGMLKERGKIVIIAEHETYFDGLAGQVVFLTTRTQREAQRHDD
jgi:energy-coupling factor transport system ATP-binding protein